MFKKLVLLILAGVLILVACQKKSQETKNIEPIKEELVIGQESEARTLDVHQGNDGSSLKITRLIYSRLVETDSDMNIQPGLAESWEQINPTTTQFHLRKGVKFHNGDNFTAEDVKFSIERMLKSPRISFVLPPIEKIEIIDDYTVNIITKTPFGPLLAHLAHPALGIVSKKQLDRTDIVLNDNPVGTGSYKFIEWKRGEKVVLEKNEDFYDKNEKGFKYIIFRPIVEDSSRVIALETGEADIILEVDGLSKETIKNNSNLQIIEKPSISLSNIGFNMNKEILKDKNLREAINYAVDRQAIIDTVLHGDGVIATSPLARKVFGFTENTKVFNYDIEKAKKLREKVGRENIELRLVTMSRTRDKQIAEIFQAYLKEINVNIKIETLESSAFYDETGKGNHDLFLGGWGVVTGDADYGLYALYHSSSKGAAGNKDFYDNKEVDKLLDEAKVEIDTKKRKSLYEQAQNIITNDVPDVLLFNRTLVVGAKKNLKGIGVHPVTLHNFATVYAE